MPHKIKKTILLFGDIFVLYFSLYSTLLIRYQENISNEWDGHVWFFSTIFILWIIIFYISNLYNLNITINTQNFTLRALRAVGISALMSILYFYLNANVSISPKTNLAIFTIIFSIIFILWRRLYNLLLSSYLPKNNIGFLGYNEQVKELIKIIKERPQLGFAVSFVIKKEEIDNIDIKKIIQESHISTVILASNIDSSPNLRHQLFSSLTLKINIINLPKFYEHITGKIPIEAISQMWFLENLSEGSKKWFDTVKRIYDIMFSSTIIAVSFPFWFIIALIIKKGSLGPVFFVQERTGKNNKNFSVIKFRTMTVNNNNYSPTIGNDKRITRFGNFLRKTRLDELPQLINILLGDMSLVGPRPERPEYIAELKKEIPFYEERMLVKPGLTGSDQISGEYHSPSKEDTLKKLQYDLYYIKNRSIYLDLSIILKTIATVFSKGGM
ncbi:sugar transferase [Candidatus Parcubacteria bacterium]|nr:sugar transferase [Patescibacteria group bacterium]MBU4309245.1 sugar transferase [Patescibacteria group bacterium]MBU4432474.1 sugar transferase [Patescibacteria group bacterium]MBU4577606.1 sugar transferase [Patescibacteria group bacterium]MCG2697293.1 sugar transferase [Candidatus Parcubacteria bacterium]